MAMTNPTQHTIAVVGATGLVGRTIVSILEERNFPVDEFVPVATESSSGSSYRAFGRQWRVAHIDEIEFAGVDYCFFTAGARVSITHVPRALDAGCRVIDNTTAYRLDDRVPLVVPEVNGDLVGADTKLVSSPNCTAIIMVTALAPIHRAVKIERVVVTSFQSVSGTGKEAVQELMEEVRAELEGREYRPAVYPKPIAFNCIAQIGDFSEEGYSGEEEKIAAETRKMLASPDLKVVPTSVRVPVKIGHSMSVNLELSGALTVPEALELLRKADGVDVGHGVPSPLDVAGSDRVVVGRVRRDATVRHGLVLWIVGDNLRKGAATNSVQIAELMLQARV
jgi:aspartate-semialdehyde dehydrogenase